VAWHSPEYRRYLKSPEWQERKRQYFSRLPRRCAACGTYKRIHLHHSSYERLTREPDNDLRPLCFRCHRNVHQANASGRFENLEAATLFIVSRGRATQWRRKQARKFPGWLIRLVTRRGSA
jgi:phage terminase large subunit GpA-like protein